MELRERVLRKFFGISPSGLDLINRISELEKDPLVKRIEVYSLSKYIVLLEKELSMREKLDLLNKYGFPRPRYINTLDTHVLREYGFTGLAESIEKSEDKEEDRKVPEWVEYKVGKTIFRIEMFKPSY